MKLEKLKKNVGWRMELAPPACHLDTHGAALPERNEDWIIQSASDEVRVTHNRMMTWPGELASPHVVEERTAAPNSALSGGSNLRRAARTCRS